MKKKLFVLAALVVVLAIIGTGTLAYFSTKAVAHNVITSSSVGIHIDEYQIVDGKEEPYPDGKVSIMPGTTVSKLPKVVNDSASSYIRACVEVLVKYEGSTKFEVLSADQLEGFMDIAMNDVDWKQDGEDAKWWYYTAGPVATGKSTKPLFYTVSFDGEAMDNEYQNCEIQINVAAQAVQSANNTPESGKVWDVKGWPAD